MFRIVSLPMVIQSTNKWIRQRPPQRVVPAFIDRSIHHRRRELGGATVANQPRHICCGLLDHCPMHLPKARFNFRATNIVLYCVTGKKSTNQSTEQTTRQILNTTVTTINLAAVGAMVPE